MSTQVEDTKPPLSDQGEMDPAWRRAREYMGLDLKAADYARRLGVKAQHISNWENGVTLSRDTVEMIAEKLGLSAHYLLFGEEYGDTGPDRPTVIRQLYKMMGWLQGESVQWEPGDELPPIREDRED